MADIWVGPNETYHRLADAIAASKAGDTIYVRAGLYLNDTATIDHDLNIIGVGGRAHLQATTFIPNEKAILITTNHANVRIENLEFSGATVYEHNGAGIRMQSGNLTLINTYFHDNEDGILTHDDPTATLTIKNSEFARNGYGDGYTHAVYANHIASVTVENSYFHDQNIGHHLKSRAAQTTVTNSVFDDGVGGTSSYAIDMPNGGQALIQGNWFRQSPTSDNPDMVHFGGEGGYYANSAAHVIGNVFVNQMAGGVGIDNAAGTSGKVEADHNVFYGLQGTEVRNGVYAHDNSSKPLAGASDLPAWAPTHSGSYVDVSGIPASADSAAKALAMPSLSVTGTDYWAKGTGMTYTGGAGTNIFHGGYGPDTLIGGAGLNVFYVETSRTSVVAQPGSTDIIVSSVSYTLPNYATTLILKGSSWSVATGNDLGNLLVGESGSTLIGGKGNDTLVVGGSSTVMRGGDGDDVFLFRDATAKGVVIQDFEVGHDKIDLTALALPTASFSDGTLRFVSSGNGADLVLTKSGSASTIAHLDNVPVYALRASDVWLTTPVSQPTPPITPPPTTPPTTSDPTPPQPPATPQEFWAKGTGATYVGGAGTNVFHGTYGADNFVGGTGTNTFYIATGRTTVSAPVGSNSTIISEVSYKLPDNVKTLILQGSSWCVATGNDLGDLLVGDRQSTLIGGKGDDVLVAGSNFTEMTGGGGKDTFVFKDLKAVNSVIHDFAPGVDRIDLAALKLGANAFTDGHLQLLASGNDTKVYVDIDGSGPAAPVMLVTLKNVRPGALSASDFIEDVALPTTPPTTPPPTTPPTTSDPTPPQPPATPQEFWAKGTGATYVGGAGTNVFHGTYGADNFVGGTGTNTFYIATGRTTVSAPVGSNSTIISEVSYKLPDNVKTLILQGSSWCVATGNDLGNLLVGDRQSTLIGGKGDDVLVAGSNFTEMTGGGGKDTFVFKDLKAVNSVIHDFAPGADRIDLAALKLGAHAFTDGHLQLVASGNDTKLYVDIDASGPAAPVMLVTLKGVLPTAVHAADFLFG
jgi:Ca2+-binding RTX toxin-like protein